MLRIRAVVKSGVSFGRSLLMSTMSDITASPEVQSHVGICSNVYAASCKDSVAAVELQTGDCLQMSAITADNSANQNLSKKALKRLKRWELKKQQKLRALSENGSADSIQKPKKAKGNVDEEVSDVITESDLYETDYYFEGGLRKVSPYYYQFTSHAKGRWFGQKLVDVFTKEFRDYSLESCQKAIESGRITVNGKTTNIHHVIQNGDFITNAVHRHELPVTGDPLEIIEDNENVVVINKPSSIPIHPCGRYRHNSIIYILAKEHGYRNLRGIYRLDRLTSGVLIFCKSEEKTREMMKMIKDRNVQKEYICKVDGQFPSSPVECNEPIDVLSHKLGVYRCGPGGKESKTVFELMSTDGQTSIVRCKPHTGRTHQIRVHLQFLGFPITNDPVYNGDVWGPENGKGGHFGKSDEQLIADLEQKHNFKNHLDLLSDDGNQDAVSAEVKCCDAVTECTEDAPPIKRIRADGDVSPSAKSNYDPDCRECQLRFRDPSPDQLIMYLHALRYQGAGWCYSTRLPKWAECELNPS